MPIKPPHMSAEKEKKEGKKEAKFAVKIVFLACFRFHSLSCF